MQRLHDLGLVTRLERRVGGIHAGSAGHVYALATRGQRLTSNVGPAGSRHPRKPWEPSPPFVDHILAVSELYVRLREFESAHRIDALVFQAEPACWRFWAGLAGERLVVKPDAFESFNRGDYEYRYFVEVDRATQSKSVILRKSETYVEFFLSGAEQSRSGLFPLVLFVTTDDKRRSAITEALAKLDANYWRLFRVLLSGEIPTHLLDPIDGQEVNTSGGSRGA
jgi:Replication-relaxation